MVDCCCDKQINKPLTQLIVPEKQIKIGKIEHKLILQIPIFS